jgi:anaerobic ribonucleoside-triphosphate reductase activating protein
MRIGGIDDCDMINGGPDNVAHTIFFAGCSRGCTGCHNESLQPKDSGTEVDVNFVIADMFRNEVATCVVLTGGEPMEQVDALIEIAQAAKDTNKKVWLYTGSTISQIPNKVKNVCDVIKTGAYIDKLRKKEGPLASSNQKYYVKGDDGKWI